jgi:hypothetical protein
MRAPGSLAWLLGQEALAWLFGQATLAWLLGQVAGPGVQYSLLLGQAALAWLFGQAVLAWLLGQVAGPGAQVYAWLLGQAVLAWLFGQAALAWLPDDVHAHVYTHACRIASFDCHHVVSFDLDCCVACLECYACRRASVRAWREDGPVCRGGLEWPSYPMGTSECY